MSIEVNIVDSFQPQIEAAVKKMQAENLDTCDIPGSGGLVLLRQDSANAQKLMNQDPVLDLLVPVTIEGQIWLITL